jgi:hypothetical protein
MPPSGGHLHDIVGEQERQKARDKKLWVWEVRWARQHGVTKMKCPCTKCAGKGS